MSRTCAHCGRTRAPEPLAVVAGDDATGNRSVAEQSAQWFCRSGCMVAWNLINDMGLQAYYALAAASGDKSQSLPASCVLPEMASPADQAAAEMRYEVWNSPLFQSRYVRQPASDNSPTARRELRLRLADISCFACVWLCEGAVAKQFPGAQLSVNLATATATVNFDPDQHRLSAIGALLDRLGYRPVPIDDALTTQKNQGQVIRLGVASACALNIMALAAADYVAPSVGAGTLSPEFAALFRWLSLAFAIPVVTYAAYPFYGAAWRQARARRLSIDQGITLALVTGFVASAWHTFAGDGPVYFDSLCAGVAVLLAGRMILAAVVRRTERALGACAADLEQPLVRLIGGEASLDQTTPEAEHTPPSELQAASAPFTFVDIETVRPGQIIAILPGEMLPLRATVVAGRGEINLGPITGEPRTMRVAPGVAVPACARNGSELLHVRADEAGAEGFWRRTQSLISSMMTAKGDAALAAERVATWFYGLVFISTALFVTGTLALGALDARSAITRAVAALLIACPCAFGFAAPLCYAAGARRALGRGIAFRSVKAMEQLWRARHFFFDKTGTLSESVQQSCKVQVLGTVRARELAALVTPLTGLSTHRWAKLLAAWCAEAAGTEGGQVKPATAFSEILGMGMSARVQGRVVQIGREHWLRNTVRNSDAQAPAPPHTTEETEPDNAWDRTWIGIDGEIVAVARAMDRELPDAQATLQWLHDRGVQTTVLSGDRQDRVNDLAERLGLPQGTGDLLPSEKADRIRTSNLAVMVGNGVNDSLAMAGAAIGVAVFGAEPAARASADVALLTPGLHVLRQAIMCSESLRRSLLVTFGFALTYNICGLVAAWSGWVSPAVAALAMPMSSLVVIRLATIDFSNKSRNFGLKYFASLPASHRGTVPCP